MPLSPIFSKTTKPAGDKKIERGDTDAPTCRKGLKALFAGGCAQLDRGQAAGSGGGQGSTSSSGIAI